MSKTKSKKSRKNKTKKSQIKKDKCCMCEKSIKGKSLVPVKCLMKHGERAHTICSDCWWKNDGFATEGENHECPGCIKKMPLRELKKESKTPKTPIILDLTEDST